MAGKKKNNFKKAKKVSKKNPFNVRAAGNLIKSRKQRRQKMMKKNR